MIWRQYFERKLLIYISASDLYHVDLTWHEVVNLKSGCRQEIGLLENGAVLTFPSVVTQILQKVDTSGFDCDKYIVPDNILNIFRAIHVVRFPPLQHQRTSLLAHLPEMTFQLNYDTCRSHAP